MGGDQTTKTDKAQGSLGGSTHYDYNVTIHTKRHVPDTGVFVHDRVFDVAFKGWHSLSSEILFRGPLRRLLTVFEALPRDY
jgi:hypothetical protein